MPISGDTLMSHFAKPPGLIASGNIRLNKQSSANSSTYIRNTLMEKIELAPGFMLAKMEVSQTIEVKGGKNYRKKIGDVLVPVPTMAALGITDAALAMNEETKQPEKDDYGLPVYVNPEHDITQSALRGAFFVVARNRLVSGTVQIQDGKKFPASWAEAAESAERSGEHLKALAEAAVSFAAYIQSLGKNEVAVARWKKFFRDSDAMGSQADAMKQKGKEYLAEFVKTLEPSQYERYGKAIINFDSACDTEEVKLEDM